MAEVEFGISAISTKPLIEKFPYLFQYAASTAINDAAFDAKKRLANQAKQAFKNPKPTTINAGYVYTKSTPQTLRARFGLKDFLPKGTAPDVYLRPQIYGGLRREKRMEKVLIRAGVMPKGTYFIPVSKTIMDQYGQMRGSTITAMLSHLQAFGEQGYRANIKNPRRSMYFAVKYRGDMGILSPGVYRWINKKNDEFELVGLFVSKDPTYRKRFYYFETVEKAVRMTFPTSFSRRFQAMARKRIREFNLQSGKTSTRRVMPLP